MKNTKKILPGLLVFVLAMMGCTLTGPAATEEVIPPTDTMTPSPTPIIDLSGTWYGTLLETGVGGRLFEVILEFTHDTGTTEIQGSIHLELQEGIIVEDYQVSGTFDGTTLRFLTTNEQYYTATFSAPSLTGYMTWNCYDCEDNTVATFSFYPEGQEPTRTPLPPALVDLHGTWTGTLTEFGPDGRVFNVELILSHLPGSNDLQGDIHFTLPDDSSYLESYIISGTVTGNTFQFRDSATEAITHFFWGLAEGDSMTGQVSFFCYECVDAYAVFSLSR